MSDDLIGTRLDDLAAATIKLTEQVTILSTAVVDLRRLREQQNDLQEQQVATDQRARIGLVHALDASDQVHTVDERINQLRQENQLALRRTSNKTRIPLIILTVLLGAFVALQIDHHVDDACPRPYEAAPLSKAACALVLPGEPGSYPPGVRSDAAASTPRASTPPGGTP